MNSSLPPGVLTTLKRTSQPYSASEETFIENIPSNLLCGLLLGRDDKSVGQKRLSLPNAKPSGRLHLQSAWESYKRQAKLLAVQLNLPINIAGFDTVESLKHKKDIQNSSIPIVTSKPIPPPSQTTNPVKAVETTTVTADQLLEFPAIAEMSAADFLKLARTVGAKF